MNAMHRGVCCWDASVGSLPRRPVGAVPTMFSLQDANWAKPVFATNWKPVSDMLRPNALKWAKEEAYEGSVHDDPAVVD